MDLNKDLQTSFAEPYKDLQVCLRCTGRWRKLVGSSSTCFEPNPSRWGRVMSKNRFKVLTRLLKARLKVLLKVLIRLLKARLKVLLKVLIRLLKARLKVLLKVLVRLLKAPLKIDQNMLKCESGELQKGHLDGSTRHLAGFLEAGTSLLGAL